METLTPKMRTTLEALRPYESMIDAGTTRGEVEQSGGSRNYLYRAVKLGYAARYSDRQGFYSTEVRSPRYYLTTEGLAALKS